MPDPLLASAILAAALVAGGSWAVICGLIPRHVRLSDAFAGLSDDPWVASAEAGPMVVADATSRLEHLGAWVYQYGRLRLPAQTERVLTLQGRSIGDFVVNKLVLAVGGLVMPSLVALALRPLTGTLGSFPLGVGLVCALAGWFWPNLAIRNHQQQTSADAEEALNTFFDLVVLERLANKSAIQSLEAAARLSDAPVFVRLRGALEQARLEQRAPWPDLQRLARDLDLSPIADMADVMRLDDQGAALADVLTSRVKELRDAHLNRERTRAHQDSERMTIWMTIPVIVFALVYLTPPLLTIAGVG